MKSAHLRSSRHDEAVTRLHQAEYFAKLGRNKEAGEMLGQAQHAFRQMNMDWHCEQAEKLSRAI